jgi:hypothetical protein
MGAGMSSTDVSNSTDPPTYIGSTDPPRRSNDYYPWWLDNLADDVTGEGAVMRAVEAIHSLVTYARTLYEYQEFKFHSDDGDYDFLEDYTTQILGEPTGVVVLVKRNAAGEAQHILVNHRPRSSVPLLARLCAEKFAGTPRAEIFVASEAHRPLRQGSPPKALRKET